TGLDAPELRGGIADLVAAGLVTSDGFAGLRAIVDASGRRPGPAGRWSIVPYRQDRRDGHDKQDGQDREHSIEIQARALLQRYGIVFRRVLAREVNMAPWRDLARIYRRLEARGEIRGGRFVSGMSGEQFALPDAVSRIREVRRTAPAGRLITISAADPLNLAGIVTAGDRVRAVASNRVVYRDGVPLAALEGEFMRSLTEVPAARAADVATALTGRPMPPVLNGFVGYSGGVDFRLSAFDFRLSTFGFRLSTFGFRLSAFGFRLSPRRARRRLVRRYIMKAERPMV